VNVEQPFQAKGFNGPEKTANCLERKIPRQKEKTENPEGKPQTIQGKERGE